MPRLEFLGNYLLFFYTLSYVVYMRNCARIIRRGAEKRTSHIDKLRSAPPFNGGKSNSEPPLIS